MNPPDPAAQEQLRALPAVQTLLDSAALSPARARYGRDAVLAATREILEQLRADITALGARPDVTEEIAAKLILARLEKQETIGVRRAINATGVILHTGLGRAVLAAAALKDLLSELSGYSIVEIDADSGKRGHRDAATRALLVTLLGCAHATVVNNNAAATLLALAAVARGREVLVSRGQLVEIGGSFRIPDVMRESGCKLVEVGTTNRTYASDFAAAITPQTAALMVVHTSNFKLVGFTTEPTVKELVELAHAHQLPLIHDIGSGALLSNLAAELIDEPVVKNSLADGADLVLFSGDKILGGPQSGIAVGAFELVEKMRRHPLYRAFRVDKLTLRILESTLRLYLDSEKRGLEIPTLKMLLKPLEQICAEAAALAARLAHFPELHAECLDDSSRLGSGSLPEQHIPTRVVALTHEKMSAEELGSKLRAHRPPIFTRIQNGRVLLDPRTLQAGEADEIAASLL